MNTKKLTLIVDEEFHRKLKMEAARQGRPIVECVLEAVSEWMKKHGVKA
jgi:predicted HicB family RNase H-like nuclease